MSKISEGRSVSGLRNEMRMRRSFSNTLVALLVMSTIAMAGLFAYEKSETADFDLESFPESLDLPEMAPYLASSGVLSGQDDGDQFGHAVAFAGDFNNDSYDDIIVGAPYHVHNYSLHVGEAYIFFGNDADPTVPDVNITGTFADSNFGHSVAGGGDFNNDGIDDVIIGAPDYNETCYPNDLCFNGRAYIFYGSDTPPANMFATDANHTLTGEGNYDYLGYSVSFAGNFDNTYGDDVIIGAPGYDGNHNNTYWIGRTYVFLSPGTGSLTDVTYTEVSTQTDAQFGRNVSYAGNPNNDSYDDVIVGAPYYDGTNKTDCGRAYIIPGENSPSGNTYTTDASITGITGESSSNLFGTSVSFAGDVDDDNYDDDVVVGAPGYSSYTGRAYVFFGFISSGTSLNATDANVAFTGESSGAHFGNQVSTAGDFNNDGYADVIVGANLEDAFGSGGTDAGKAHIFYGGSPMNNTVDISFVGELNTTNRYKFGFSVSNAGDYDNDGFDDVVVGANNASSNKGYAHVYNFHDHVACNGTFVTAVGGEKKGYSVSTAGRFNNDSYDDIIVGAPYFGPDISNGERGRAYIYYGGDPMDTTADLYLDGEADSDHFGWSISSGDFNGDGYDDVIVGAPDYGIGESSDVGRAYIFFGGSSPNATADVTLTGENTGDRFGFSVSTAGNFRGSGFGNDDYDDAVVGAPLYDVGANTNEGRAYIFYGAIGTTMDSVADVIMTGENPNDQFGYSVSDAGDWNNDDDGDVIVGAPYYNVGIDDDVGKAYLYYGDDIDPSAEEYTFSGEGSWNYFAFSVSTAGDVDGDTCDDVIVGAPGYDGLGDNKGRAYIFLGCDTGNETTVDVTLIGEGVAGDQFGYSVSTAGDVDNDGYDDVVVGAPFNDVGGTSAGRVFIYYGESTLDAREDVVMTGVVASSAGEQLGFAVANAGDVNNDNYGDVLTGAPYWRDAYNPEKGMVKVWGDPS